MSAVELFLSLNKPSSALYRYLAVAPSAELEGSACIWRDFRCKFKGMVYYTMV